MNAEAKEITVDGVKLHEGTVYLRDRRNGRIHQFQELLAGLSHIERFVYDGTLPSATSSGFVRVNMTAQEKAADWDRLASMKPEEREAELAEREKYVEQQRELATRDTGEPAKKRLVMVNPEGPTYEAYKEQKWTDEQLIEAGHARYE